MKRFPVLILLLFIFGCTQLTMPNLPIGQVSEAFREGEVVSGEMINGEFHIPLVYNPASAYPGWNLVALPAEYESIQSNVPYKIFHYEGAGYGEIFTKGGSWVKVEQSGVLLVRGLGKQVSSQVLLPGWNQIGIGFTPVKIKNLVVENKELMSAKDAEDYIIPIFYYWDSTHGEWGFINARKAESAEKELLPGVGYFVYAKKENELRWG